MTSYLRPVEPFDFVEAMERASAMRASQQQLEYNKLRLEEAKEERSKKREIERATMQYVSERDPEKKKQYEINLMALNSESIEKINQARAGQVAIDREQYELDKKQRQDIASIISNSIEKATESGEIDLNVLQSGVFALGDSVGGNQKYLPIINGFFNDVKRVAKLHGLSETGEDPQGKLKGFEILKELQSQYELQLPPEKRPTFQSRDMFAASEISALFGDPKYMRNPELALLEHPAEYNQALSKYAAEKLSRAKGVGGAYNPMPDAARPVTEGEMGKLTEAVFSANKLSGLAQGALSSLDNLASMGLVGYTGSVKGSVMNAVDSASGGNIEYVKPFVSAMQEFKTMSGLTLMQLIRSLSGAQYGDKERVAVFEMLGNIDAVSPTRARIALKTLIDINKDTRDQANVQAIAGLDPTFALTEAQSALFRQQSEALLNASKDPTVIKNGLARIATEMQKQSQINLDNTKKANKLMSIMNGNYTLAQKQQAQRELELINPDIVKRARGGVQQAVQAMENIDTNK